MKDNSENSKSEDSNLVLETPGHIITIRRDGVIQYKVLPRETVTLEMAKKTEHILSMHIPEDKREFILFDAREALHIEVAVRKYSAEQFKKRIKAVAILLKGEFLNNLYTIFLRFQKPPYLVKSFTNEEDALVWLKEKAHKKRWFSKF